MQDVNTYTSVFITDDEIFMIRQVVRQKQSHSELENKTRLKTDCKQTAGNH